MATSKSEAEDGERRRLLESAGPLLDLEGGGTGDVMTKEPPASGTFLTARMRERLDFIWSEIK
jgi:hypothetical protein